MADPPIICTAVSLQGEANTRWIHCAPANRSTGGNVVVVVDVDVEVAGTVVVAIGRAAVVDPAAVVGVAGAADVDVGAADEVCGLVVLVLEGVVAAPAVANPAPRTRAVGRTARRPTRERILTSAGGPATSTSAS